MPRRNPDLHGNAPDSARVALLLIDVINDLEFDVGKAMLRHALPMARRIAQLKARAKAARVPVIYVNDNFGKWQSDLNAQVSHCLRDGVRGEPVVQLLRPEPEDYYVLKPKHSGFYASPLELLLERIGADTLVLTGISADNCVFFTACDAYLRDYSLVVPRDCVVSAKEADRRLALERMEAMLKADVREGRKVRFPRRRMAQTGLPDWRQA